MLKRTIQTLLMLIIASTIVLAQSTSSNFKQASQMTHGNAVSADDSSSNFVQKVGSHGEASVKEMSSDSFKHGLGFVFSARGAAQIVPPSGLTASPGDGQVALAWNPIGGSQFLGVSVYRAVTSGGPYELVVAGISGSQYLDTGLANGTPYFYVLRATYVAGESDNSMEVVGVPDGLDTTPPSAPLILSPADGLITNLSGLTIECSAEPFSLVTVFDGEDENAVSVGVTVPASGEVSFQWDVDFSGEHYLYAVAQDGAGLTVQSGFSKVVVDTQPPSASLINPFPSVGASFSSSLSLEIGYFDLVPSAGPPIVQQVFVDGIDRTTSFEIGNSSVAWRDAVLSTIGGGSHVVEVHLVDAAGNLSVVDLPFSFVADTVAPELNFVVGGGLSSYPSQTNLQVSAIARDNLEVSRITVAVFDADGALAYFEPFANSESMPTVQSLDVETDVSGSVGETYRISLSCEDSSGNVVTASETVVITPAPSGSTVEFELTFQSLPLSTQGPIDVQVRALDSAGQFDSSYSGEVYVEIVGTLVASTQLVTNGLGVVSLTPVTSAGRILVAAYDLADVSIFGTLVGESVEPGVLQSLEIDDGVTGTVKGVDVVLVNATLLDDSGAGVPGEQLDVVVTRTVGGADEIEQLSVTTGQFGRVAVELPVGESSTEFEYEVFVSSAPTITYGPRTFSVIESSRIAVQVSPGILNPMSASGSTLFEVEVLDQFGISIPYEQTTVSITRTDFSGNSLLSELELAADVFGISEFSLDPGLGTQSIRVVVSDVAQPNLSFDSGQIPVVGGVKFDIQLDVPVAEAGTSIGMVVKAVDPISGQVLEDFEGTVWIYQAQMPAGGSLDDPWSFSGFEYDSIGLVAPVAVTFLEADQGVVYVPEGPVARVAGQTYFVASSLDPSYATSTSFSPLGLESLTMAAQWSDGKSGLLSVVPAYTSPNVLLADVTGNFQTISPEVRVEDLWGNPLHHVEVLFEYFDASVGPPRIGYVSTYTNYLGIPAWRSDGSLGTTYEAGRIKPPFSILELVSEGQTATVDLEVSLPDYSPIVQPLQYSETFVGPSVANTHLVNTYEASDVVGFTIGDSSAKSVQNIKVRNLSTDFAFSPQTTFVFFYNFSLDSSIPGSGLLPKFDSVPDFSIVAGSNPFGVQYSISSVNLSPSEQDVQVTIEATVDVAEDFTEVPFDFFLEMESASVWIEGSPADAIEVGGGYVFVNAVDLNGFWGDQFLVGVVENLRFVGDGCVSRGSYYSQGWATRRQVGGVTDAERLFDNLSIGYSDFSALAGGTALAVEAFAAIDLDVLTVAVTSLDRDPAKPPLDSENLVLYRVGEFRFRSAPITIVDDNTHPSISDRDYRRGFEILGEQASAQLDFETSVFSDGNSTGLISVIVTNSGSGAPIQGAAVDALPLSGPGSLDVYSGSTDANGVMQFSASSSAPGTSEWSVSVNSEYVGTARVYFLPDVVSYLGMPGAIFRVEVFNGEMGSDNVPDSRYAELMLAGVEVEYRSGEMDLAGNFLDPEWYSANEASISTENLEFRFALYPGASFFDFEGQPSNPDSLVDRFRFVLRGDGADRSTWFSGTWSDLGVGTFTLDTSGPTHYVVWETHVGDVSNLDEVLQTSIGSLDLSTFVTPDSGGITVGRFSTGTDVNLLVPKIRVIRYDTLEDDPSDPTSGTILDADYLHIDCVSPRVIIDESLCSVIENATYKGEPAVMIRVVGRVISPVDSLGVGPATTSVWLEDEPVVLQSDGTFSHDTLLLEFVQHVTVEATNVFGGKGSDTVVVDGNATPDAFSRVGEPVDPSTYGPTAFTDRDEISDAPHKYQIVFGGVEEAGYLLAQTPVDLNLRDLSGGLVDTISVELLSQGGQVVTEPFVVTEQDYDRDAATVSALDALGQGVLILPPNAEPNTPVGNEIDPSMTPFHDIWVEVDGNERFKIEFAGVRFASHFPYEYVELNETEGELFKRDISVRTRNVEPESVSISIDSQYEWPSFDELGAPAQIMEESSYGGSKVEISGLFGPFNSDPNSTNLQVANNVSFAAGPTTLSVIGLDLSGRLFARQDLHTFVTDRKIPLMLRSEVEEKAKSKLRHVEFDIAPGTPQQAIAEVCRELDLQIVGYSLLSGVDECGALQIDSVLAYVRKGSTSRARDRVADSPIHADADPLEEPSTAAPWRAGDRKLARKQMYDREANALASVFIEPDPATQKPVADKMYVVDMRVDEKNLKFASLTPMDQSDFPMDRINRVQELLDPDAPFGDLVLTAPKYKHVDPVTGVPTYKILRLEFGGLDQDKGVMDRPTANSLNWKGKGKGRRPRVSFSVNGTAVTALGLTNLQATGIIGADTKGVILMVHGYNNDTDIERFQGMHVSDGGLAYALWPNTQKLLRDNGLNRDEYPILHILWTGDFAPQDDSDAMASGAFNLDNAIAHFTGLTLLRGLVEDIVEAHKPFKSQQGPDPEIEILIMANSLGNRVVASGLEGLKNTFALKATGLTPKWPLVRYVMGHPALRRGNVVSAPPPPPTKRAEFRLQDQMEGVGINEHGQHVLVYYSEYDKAGIAFHFSQEQHSMLGRCGLPSTYVPGNEQVQFDAIFSQVENPEATDLWHVKLMGWTLPGMFSESRPRRTFNRVTKGNVSIVDAAIAVGTTEAIVHITSEHIDPIWSAIGDYFLNGTIPP